ncbi:ATP-binding protein [Streptomyces winkii]|uniref:ATP-binding protein n=1 Tax=Streptomyces winkii TaxID=3051178 RepID=UPI0028D0291F|nr:ATP-binding protein [Streptomyces sp. DSM 40971]
MPRREELTRRPDELPRPEELQRPEDKPIELVEFLSPIPEAVPVARRHVVGVLHEWGLSTLTETASLLACELVSNAVKHGSPAAEAPTGAGAQQIVLTVRHHAGLFIEVWDPGSKGLHPRVRAAAPHDEVGRGLQLVDTLSRSWGHYAPAYGGRTVWCELVTPRRGERSRH